MTKAAVQLQAYIAAAFRPVFVLVRTTIRVETYRRGKSCVIWNWPKESQVSRGIVTGNLVVLT